MKTERQQDLMAQAARLGDLLVAYEQQAEASPPVSDRAGVVDRRHELAQIATEARAQAQVVAQVLAELAAAHRRQAHG